MKLPGSEAAQPIRIEKSLGSLATEAWESITTIVTIGAIVAAPFTGGASLAILVPIGVVGAGIASYRLMQRHQLGTLAGISRPRLTCSTSSVDCSALLERARSR